MKTIPLFISFTAVWLGWGALPAPAQPVLRSSGAPSASPGSPVTATAEGGPPVPGPAYVRSTVGPPWGVSANENAMDRVFGAGQWRDLRFETLNVPLFLSESTFVFLEGSDQGAQSMENFLIAHLAEIENWVSAGGVLFLNAAPNVGDGMSLGFGVTLLYSDGTASARAENASHPIFNEPFMPVGTFWNGSFGHATVSGPGITPLIANNEHGRLVLAEKAFGNGWVLFGGMTTDNFHSPQPETQNLRANILAYANGQIIPPTNQPPEILTQPASQAVLAGQTVTLIATARGSRPLSLQWFFNGQPLPGATNSSLVLTTVTTNQAGGYKLVASNALGFATSERATLTVSLQGPRITLHPTSRSARAGEDVTFSVLATGGPLFYQWRHNRDGVETVLTGATNATLFLTAVTTHNAGVYQVAVSNLLGYVTSLPATLTVNQFAPTILSEPSDVTAQSGDNVQFYVGADGAPLPVYQWRFNAPGAAGGVDLPGETNATLFLPNVTTNRAGAYSAVVSNSVGSVTSRAAVLTVNEFPPSLFSQPFNQTVSAGTDVYFSVGAGGSPPLTFHWRHNGTNLTGATNATLFLPAVHPNRAGVYTVAVSNHLGFVISQPAVLTVFGGAAPVITSQPANFTLLVGGSTTLIVSASGQPTPTYQWYFSPAGQASPLPGATLSFLTLANVTTNQAGNYTVVASNLFGAVTSRVAVVTVNLQAPIITTQPASRTVDAGSTVVLSVTASAGPPPSYQWLFNNGNGVEPIPTARGSSLVLSNVFTNQAGIYSVIVSNELGAVLSAPATLTVNGSAPMITTQPASRTVLDGSNATFSVVATGIPQVTYQWRFQATGAAGGVDLPGRNSSVLTLTSVSTNAAGEYTVVVSNLLGVVVSAPAILTVTQQAPVITAQTTNRTVVVGSSVIFQVLVVAGPRPTYQWQRNRDGVETILTGANNSSLVLSNVSRADEGIYTVVVSNPLGYAISQPMRLTVVYQPPTITGNPTNRSVPAGGSASFTVTATGSAPLFYQWRFNGADLPGATNRTLVLTSVTTNQAGAYSCLVTNFGGERVSGVATLTVTVQPPIITTQPANRTVPGGTNVTFTVVATGAPSPTYQWRFHNGNGVEPVPTATNAQLALTNVGTNHAGGYSVVVSNPFGSITSRVAILTVIVQATVITVQPADRTVRPGGSVTFSVSATGTPPLMYQWDFNGDDILGATNATLPLTGVTVDNEGSYRVTITGAGGTVVSRKADLTLREAAIGDFRIDALLTNNARLVEHNFVTGDDRGGIAASSTRVFYSGDSQTAGFALADLSGGTGVGRIFDALVSDLNSETVYSLGNGANPLGGGGTVTSLIELNGTTGQPTANLITLSDPIEMQGGSGLFAGYDQIALFSGARVYTIELSSGLVIDHGPFSMPSRSGCENWATWGVAEQIDGELYLAYVRDSQTIARVRVTDGLVEPIATFSSLSDMCSFTLSLALNRWYFHHEGQSQFGGNDEGIGYADAAWEVPLPGPPIIRTQPQSLTALAGYAAQFSVAAAGARPLTYQWRFNGADLPGATSQTLLFTRVTTNDTGGYTVVVANALGAVTSQVATLTVELVAPSILAQPIGRSAFEGARVSFSVIATGAPPPFYQWQFNGADIVGATNRVFTLAQVTTNDAGSYRVLVSNLAGSVTSDSAALTVRSGTNLITALLIWDVLEEGTTALRTALENAGILVTLSDTSETAYDGTNPAPDGFNAVIHLNGVTYGTEMPLAGQDALVRHVQEGGGYIHNEWNALEIVEGRMQRMRELILLDRIDGREGTITYTAVPEELGHLILANVPPTFMFQGGVNNGRAHSFAVDPATVLMRDGVNDAVVVREFGPGRIVGFSHAGNYNHPNLRTLLNSDIQQLYIDGVLWAAGGSILDLPPYIVVPPADRTVALGRTAIFRVGARGTRPLSYQWRFNGIDLSGATNVTLTITNAALNQAGSYAVVVTNAFGSVTSAAAVLNVVDLTAEEFYIVNLTTNNARAVEHSGTTGDDRGGIAASFSRVFVSGDDTTGGFNLADLSNPFRVNQLHDSMTGDLQTGRIYVLADESGPLGPGGIATGLIELNGETGLVTSNRVELSAPIDFQNSNGEVGIFAGYGRIVLRADRRVISIFLPSGIVEDAGTLAPFPHAGAESWAYWGVAEYFNDALWLVYVRDAQHIVRTRVPDGLTLPVADFENLSDMASITLSLPLNRWYFHHEGTSVFRSGDETLGFADATFSNTSEPRPPAILLQPRDRFAREGRTASFEVLAVGNPLNFQWRFHATGAAGGADIAGATNRTLLLANVTTNQAGIYSVVINNLLGSVTSSNALLTVITHGGANARVAILGAPGEPAWAEDVRAKLSNTLFFDTVDHYQASDPAQALTLDELLQYGAALVYSDAGFFDPTALGDLLADYVDLGGGVVVATFALTDNLSALSGRFITEGYLPFTEGGPSVDPGRTLVPDLPDHPILAGVETFDGGSSGFRNSGLALASDATLVAHYVGGDPLVGVKETLSGRVVGLNFFPPSTDVRSDFWDASTDGASLMANALLWAGQSGVSRVPTITQPPQSVDGLWGGSAQFNVVAEGALLSYQWQRSTFNVERLTFTNLPGATAETLLLSNLSSDNAGSYAVVVRNPFGAVTSAPVVLTVSALAPTVTTPPVSQTVVLGVDVLFAAEITAAPQAALQWFFNNAALPGLPSGGWAAILGATNATLLLTNVTMSAAGSYRIVADNFAGSAISPVATLTVIPQVPLPVALDTPGQEWITGGDALWAGQPFTSHDGVDAAQSGFLFDDEASWLQTTVTGPGQASFQWKVSSEAGYDFVQFTMGGAVQAAIAGEVGWQQRTFNFPSGPQTLRWAYVKDGSVSEGADRAWLDEVRFEIAPRIVTQPVSQGALRGSNATFTVVATGVPAPTYQWQFNGANLPAATNASLVLVNVATNQAGTYRVVASNPHGNVTSVQATLQVFDPSQFPLASNYTATVLFQDALLETTMTLAFDGASYWSSSGGGPDGQRLARYDANGLFQARYAPGLDFRSVFTDASGNLFARAYNDRRILRQNAPGVFVPTGVVLASGPLDDQSAVVLNVAGTEYLAMGSSGVVSRWSTNGAFLGSVTLQGYGSVPGEGNWAIAVAGEFWFTYAGNGSLSAWDANGVRVAQTTLIGAGSSTYSLSYANGNIFIVDSAGGTWRGYAVAPTPAPPFITVQPLGRTVPAGAAVAFTVTATGHPLTYQWRLNGTDLPGATNQTLALDYVLPANAGDYTVVVSNPLGTVTSAPATLILTVQAPVITAQPASQAVLGGGSVALSVTATGVPAPTYQWKRDGADLPGATNATLTLNNATAADAGTYKVIVRNLAGTATSLPARLTVNILAPQITLQPVSQSVLRGTNVTFTVAATGAPAPAYQWRFNDTDLAGETSALLTIRQPTAASAGRYTVRVSNDGGTVTSLAAELVVVESIALGEALDLPGLLWRSGGAMSWFGQPMIAHDSVDAASSGGTSDSRESWLETTVTGPGTVSFWWKVSSELGFDRLNFTVGRVALATVTGETEWQALSFPLPDGPQTLRWSYAKDGSARDGADAGWVDQVVITTSPVLIVHAAIIGADVRISFPSSPGRRYLVERADDLTHPPAWQPVAGAENVPGTGLTLEVLDAAGAGFAQRFYRVTLLP